MTMLRKKAPKLLFRLLPRTATSIIVAAVVALPAGAGTAIALADTGDTSAVAINTKDGSSVFRLSFAVRQVNGSVVDPQNAAVAIASCTDCQTVAISFEIVLASGDATTVSPVNEAIALNLNCTSCQTLAAADQFVYALGTKLKLTAEARQGLAAIRQQLEQLRQSGFTDIQSEVIALMGQLSGVLQNQVIGVNDPAAGPNAGTAALAPASSSPTSTPPTATTTTPASAPTDTTTPTSTPTDTTTSPASTPTDTATTPTGTPSDTTSSGTATTPTSSSTSPTTTTTTTPTTTTTTP